jgi:hypothetical protein
MKNNITSPTKNRRKIVVPFAGEENFVVPKKGGFGQPDNDKYVMVAGSTSRTPIVTDLSTATPTAPIATESATPTATTTPSVPAESTTTTTPRTTTIPVESAPTPPIAIVETTPSTPAPTTTTSQPCVYDPNDLSTYGCKPKTVIAVEQAPIVGITPTFPNWASLDCTTLKAKIDELNRTMAVSRFTTSVIDTYNSQLAIAKDLLQTNCPNENPNTDVTAGGFGSGGGGGAPEDGVPTEEMPTEEGKSNIGTWLLLGGVALGLYLLSKRA